MHGTQVHHDTRGFKGGHDLQTFIKERSNENLTCLLPNSSALTC